MGVGVGVIYENNIFYYYMYNINIFLLIIDKKTIISNYKIKNIISLIIDFLDLTIIIKIENIKNLNNFINLNLYFLDN